MANKKILYLVTSASSILAAAIVKMNDESTEFEPSLKSSKSQDLKKVWDENFPGKKFPASIAIDEDGELKDDESPLVLGIQLYAYDVNNGQHFHSLMRVINGDAAEIKALSDKGQVLVDLDNHRDNLKTLTGEKKSDVEVDEDTNTSNPEPIVEPQPEANPAPIPSPEIETEPLVENKIDVPADSVISEPVVNSETNTVNSETNQAVEESTEVKEEDTKDSAKNSKKK